ncbi:MAG: sugar kinase [Chloroflexi bacterium]|nr:sugar kinase [Chloroflexota bacterium]
MVEVVALGEAMLRLSPPGYGRLESATRFEVVVGGSELNVAAALAHLGRSVDFVTKLPTSPLGRLVASTAREHGVQVEHTVWSSERLGLYFYEQGLAPRPSQVVYDRAGSAASTLHPRDVPWEAVLAACRIFHTSGITAALSAESLATVEHALRVARSQGITTTFDLNYRSRLWSASQATQAYERLLPHCSVVFASAGALETFFHLRGSPEAAAEELCRRFGVEWTVLTERSEDGGLRGSIAALASGRAGTYRSQLISFEIADRLGGGDAFAAGFIDGLLTNDLHLALNQGATLAALKHTIPGEFCTITREELSEFLAHGARQVLR